MALHRRYLQLLQSAAPRKRTWLLKSPEHLLTLDGLCTEYPDAVVNHDAPRASRYPRLALEPLGALPRRRLGPRAPSRVGTGPRKATGASARVDHGRERAPSRSDGRRRRCRPRRRRVRRRAVPRSRRASVAGRQGHLQGAQARALRLRWPRCRPTSRASWGTATASATRAARTSITRPGSVSATPTCAASTRSIATRSSSPTPSSTMAAARGTPVVDELSVSRLNVELSGEEAADWERVPQAPHGGAEVRGACLSHLGVDPDPRVGGERLSWPRCFGGSRRV
jgi:hypothetical protein